VLGVLLAASGVIGVAEQQARADVTTDDAGSIVIYPKVVSDGTRDTLIQLSNRSNMPAFVHCFYVNTAGRCNTATTERCRLDRDCPAGDSCVRTCDENDFDVILTAQQPTIWRTSTGRLESQTPGPCRIGQPCTCSIDAASGQQICPGLELSLGGGNNATYAPPVGTEFEGELKCYQTDGNGFPVAGNSLKGTAMIEDLPSGQISEYNALTVSANADPVVGVNQGQDLQLNFSGSGAGEYNYCPASLVFTHYGDQAVDAFSNATVSTEITLVPCTELIEERAPTPVSVSFVGFNEFEQRFSADAISFDCYFSRSLADIPNEGQPLFVASAGQWWKTRITPSSSNICLTGANRGLTCPNGDSDCPGFLVSPEGTSLGCQAAPGVLGVVEEFHALSGQPVGTAAGNMHVEGQRTGLGDIIVVPSLQ
jgi:hypothetical protein